MVSPGDPGEQGGLIRVLLGDVPGIRGQLVRRLIEQQPDMVLVGEVGSRVGLLVAAADGADVVILGAVRVYPPPGICSHLLSERPDLRILVLSTESDAAGMYWLGLRRERLRTVTAESLTHAIRRAYARNASV